MSNWIAMNIGGMVLMVFGAMAVWGQLRNDAPSVLGALAAFGAFALGIALMVLADLAYLPTVMGVTP